MQYRARDVSALYDVTPQTVGMWASEFAQYMSPTANPGHKKKRLFTHDDMAVLDLVAQMRDQGATTEEIHASLKTGSRGSTPAIEPNEVQSIVSREHESRLSLENERLQHALLVARSQLEKAKKDLERLDEVEKKSIQLEAQLESERQSKQEVISLLKAQVEDLTKRNEELSLRAGTEYARGFVEGFREQAPKGQGAQYLKE
jgi:DNA-binding transcriptional MerR regulator